MEVAENLKRIPYIERNWAITEDHLNMACNMDEAAKHEQVLVVTTSLDDTLEAYKAAENSIVRNFNRFNR
ncbi:hypothetical protein [Muriicola sp.]|uniref:hypothetical protein n=1 Tax=Muriicola sp. TaxID=2020856 RepID=UPI003C7302E7